MTASAPDTEPARSLPPASVPRRSLSRGRMVGFSLFSLLAFLVALELLLQGLAARSDEHGEFPSDGSLAQPIEDLYRVVAVGDSWVYGAESQPSEAFIEVFSDRFTDRSHEGVQVYNLGVSASNSAQSLLALSEVIELVRPDLVVALTGANNMLHDIGVAEAGQIMGDDARMVPGLTLLSRLRLVRLGRLIWVTVFAQHQDRVVSHDAASGFSKDPFDTPGLPEPPARRMTQVVNLPWWELFVQRRWEDGLRILEDTPLPAGTTPRQQGVKDAWAALFLAYLDRSSEAEAKIASALALGGDPATAWEARAILAQRRDEPLFALQYRVRAAQAEGLPWIRERARGLALMELEAWQAAQCWLLGVQDASPGNLEVLMGLARLPSIARHKDTDDALYKGPRGLVSRSEYFAWHLASSGEVGRAVGSLGDVEGIEAPLLQNTRARGAEVEGRTAAAIAGYRAVLARADASTLDLDRARSGLLRLTSDLDELESWLGQPLAAVQVSAANVGALVGWYREHGTCEEAVRAGQLGLERGYSPTRFEMDAGECLARGLGWSLAEQVISRGVVIDRSALVLGQDAGTLPSSLSAPAVHFWDAFQERRYGFDPDRVPLDWQALLLAHDERSEEALARADRAVRWGAGDPVVIACARAMALRQQGHYLHSFIAAVRAAVGKGDPWVSAICRGWVLIDSRRYQEGQRLLLEALRVAPGYLEALEMLSLVPRPVRLPATEVALRHSPSGQVPGHRWARWYLDQERVREARLALQWPAEQASLSPRLIALRALQQARILESEGQVDEAARGFARASLLARQQGMDGLACRAEAEAARGGASVDNSALVATLDEACLTHPEAVVVAATMRAIEGHCEQTRKEAWKAAEAGADPLAVLPWIEPCVSVEELGIWMRERLDRLDAPEQALGWLLGRYEPGNEEKLAQRKSRPEDPLLVRHLDAMHRLSRSQGARFVALTYPFPGGHHLHLRDVLVELGPQRDVPVLDLYGHFEHIFAEAEWQEMRTPEDHINARGYREMGELLFQYLAEQDGRGAIGRIPR